MKETKIYLHGLHFNQPYIVSYEVEKKVKHYKVTGKREVILGTPPEHTIIRAGSENITRGLVGAKMGLRNLLRNKQHESEEKAKYFKQLQEEISKQVAEIDPDKLNEMLFN